MLDSAGHVKLTDFGLCKESIDETTVSKIISSTITSLKDGWINYHMVVGTELRLASVLATDGIEH